MYMTWKQSISPNFFFSQGVTAIASCSILKYVQNSQNKKLIRSKYNKTEQMLQWQCTSTLQG